MFHPTSFLPYIYLTSCPIPPVEIRKYPTRSAVPRISVRQLKPQGVWSFMRKLAHICRGTTLQAPFPLQILEINEPAIKEPISIRITGGRGVMLLLQLGELKESKSTHWGVPDEPPKQAEPGYKTTTTSDLQNAQRCLCSYFDYFSSTWEAT